MDSRLHQRAPLSSPGIAVRRTASLRSPMPRRSWQGEQRAILIGITGSRRHSASKTRVNALMAAAR